MSAALLDDLLAGYLAPVRAFAAPTPAKAANRKQPCGPALALTACDGPQIPANPASADAQGNPDSQTFAGTRKPKTGPRSEETSASSQVSQNSQGSQLQCATVSDADLAGVAWPDGDISRFLDRRARLLRWGRSEAEAEKLAERLTKIDREHDERVSCVDCRHYRPGSCGNHRRAGLNVPQVGFDLASLLQHCPGFGPLKGKA